MAIQGVFSFKNSHPDSDVMKLKKHYRATSTQKADDVIARAEFFDRKRAQPMDILSACMDRDDIARALEICASGFLDTSESYPTENAVYLVGNESQTAFKVGLAKNPVKRMCGLQNGCWERLSFLGLFWSMDSRAELLERAVLQEAKRRELRLVGEWVSGDAFSIGWLIAETIKANRYRISSPQMFMRHRRMLSRCIAYQRDNKDFNYDDPDIEVKEIDEAA